MSDLDPILEQLLGRSGTDLHLGIGHPPLARVDDKIVPLPGGDMTADRLVELIDPLLLPHQREELTAELSVEFSYAIGERASFRATAFYKSSGLAAHLRLVPWGPRSLVDLGADPGVLTLADRASGLVVVAGPPRSGKSTLLAAMLRHVIESRTCRVLAIGDPIETVHASDAALVTQREIGQHAASFEEALWDAAGEDVDVVAVSDLVGPIATRRALQLASSGILVLACVSARRTTPAIQRLLAVPDEELTAMRTLVADALAGVIAQELVPGNMGGRHLVQEVLVLTPELLRTIGQADATTVAGEVSKVLGERCLDAAIERLAVQGKITDDMMLQRHSTPAIAEKRLRAP